MLRRLRIFASLLVSSILFGSLVLGAPTLSASSYHARMWRTEDGLPHNSVTRCVQDQTGFLWFATLGGLARFDGRAFKELPLPNVSRTGEYNIRSLVADPKGGLLVISATGLVYRISENSALLHPVSAYFGKAGDAPADIYVDSSGAVWVASYSGSLLRWTSDGHVQQFNQGKPVAQRGKRFTFATDAHGNVWIAADHFLAVFRNGTLENYPAPPDGPLLLGQGRGGGVWVCSESQLHQIEGGKLHAVVEHVPWEGAFNAVRGLYEDSRGELWIARSRGGLLRLHDAQFEVVSTPYTSIADVIEDREGSLWVASDADGVGRLRAKGYTMINVHSGLTENSVSALCQDAEGRVWLANRTGGTASVSPNGELEIESWAKANRIFANVVATDATGSVWFGGGRSGLYRQVHDSGAYEKLPLPVENLHVLYRAKNGDVWFSADGGPLGYYRDGVPHLVQDTEHPRISATRAVGEDEKGTIWIAARDGQLARWEGRSLALIAFPPDLPKLPIHDLHVEGVDRLWLATAGGVLRYDHGAFRLLSEIDGLPDNLILQVTEDDFGRLWLNSRRGLFFVSKDDLQRLLHNEVKNVSVRRFGRDQGLGSLSPIGDYAPKTWKARDGTLWFATAQGAIAVAPSATIEDVSPPPVVIDEVRIDGELQDTHRALRVASGPRRVEFRFAAPSFLSLDDVEIGYRLTGIDLQWIDAGDARIASYTHLPPGPYQLEVRARHRGTAWAGETARYDLVVIPAWWETLWAKVCGVMLFTGLTAWTVRAISQGILRRRLERLEREHALEKERARIARDLHDELGSGLTELGLLAERIARVPSADAPRLLKRLSTRTRRLSADLGSIIWTTSGRNGRLDRLAVFLGQYAQRLFRNTGIRCSIHGAEAIPDIPLLPDPQYQLLTATKEALNNILKHAEASSVELRVRFAEGVFEILIRDDGVGFDAANSSAVETGNGLSNMRSRLDEIGGTFAVHSARDEGTTITFALPFSDSSPPRRETAPTRTPEATLPHSHL